MSNKVLLAVWTGYGIAVYGLFRLVQAGRFGFLAWRRYGPYVAGGAVVAAGLYQLSPLKRGCLRRCRSPLHYVLGGWRDGRVGALTMGFEHGAYCLGCCWGLMAILFALGIMSLWWMTVVTALIFVEKVTPVGSRLTPVFAVTFVAAGVWLALAPASLPGLHQPGMQMGTRR